MKKSLQALFGILLVLLLAYLSFLDVSSKIKDDLLLKAKGIFSERNIRGVSATIQGEGICMSRTLVLTGTTISEVERVRIVTLTENIEGVFSVNNQIQLHPVVPKAPVVPKLPTAIKVPSVPSSTEVKVTKSIPKEPVETKKYYAKPVENKEDTTLVSSTEKSTKVPVVPVVVVSKSIIVPTPVKVVDAPKVIEVEKVKFEGVK